VTGCNFIVDADAIAVATFDLPGKANVMNDDFMCAMDGLVRQLEVKRRELKGVIVTSAKHTFFAGGDLVLMSRAEAGQEDFLFRHFERLKSYFRRLERLGIPLVAAINGTALGGGYELCLACHRRIALSKPDARIGLPEINFGILPAAGGVIRLTGLLGLDRALDYLLTGRKVDMTTALDEGLVDQLVETQDQLLAEARRWILSTPDAVQPWDRPRSSVATGYRHEQSRSRDEVLRCPGDDEGPENGAAIRIAEIAERSTYIDFDEASQIETRGFVELLLTSAAKERISGFFERSKV
jgi:3-hydroxyacyl-CoA dehydrogenase/enoyl-CoA hydratase/3-hydroxybutyryl-CoA epimerase